MELRKVDPDFRPVCACEISDEPCNPYCSCRTHIHSGGCLNCATYGSPEQKKAMADFIQKRLAEYRETIKSKGNQIGSSRL